MNKAQQYLVSKGKGCLQIPYKDYEMLVKKAEEAERLREVKNMVLAQLGAFLGEDVSAKAKTVAAKVESVPVAPVSEVRKEKPVQKQEPAKKQQPAAAKPAKSEPKATVQGRPSPKNIEIPPIKKEIADHFNAFDESGRLFSVFKQYYTCLNDACGGTVRVTMKDGVCSLWNYDAWEEFAFVDIFEGNLRFGVNPRYTDDLSSMDFCEVPRLLSSRHSLVCVQVGDLSNTMLKVMVKAFEEAMAAS